VAYRELLKAGGRKNVNDTFRCHRSGDDLSDGVIQLFLWPYIARRSFGEDGLHRLEECHIIANP
jgi:hypothetical protein